MTLEIAKSPKLNQTGPMGSRREHEWLSPPRWIVKIYIDHVVTEISVQPGSCVEIQMDNFEELALGLLKGFLF